MLKLPLNVRHLSCFVPYFVFCISIFWISFFYILHLYIATPPCWLLCMTLLTPFLRSAQMNSKSSKSVLCCGPCQSISILRIVCRLSFSFIFSNAQQLHSLLRCMIVFCLFLKTIVESKRLRPLIFLDQVIQYCQYCVVNIVRPSRSLESFADYRSDSFFFRAWNISSRCSVWTMPCSPGTFLRIMVKGERRFPLKYIRSDLY